MCVLSCQVLNFLLQYTKDTQNTNTKISFWAVTEICYKNYIIRQLENIQIYLFTTKTYLKTRFNFKETGTSNQLQFSFFSTKIGIEIIYRQFFCYPSRSGFRETHRNQSRYYLVNSHATELKKNSRFSNRIK